MNPSVNNDGNVEEIGGPFWCAIAFIGATHYFGSGVRKVVF